MNKRQYRKAKSKFFHNRVFKWWINNDQNKPILLYCDGFFYKGKDLDGADEQIALELMHMSDINAFYAAHALQIAYEEKYKHFYRGRVFPVTWTFTS